MPKLSLLRIEKSYQGKPILRQLQLETRDCEYLVLLGQSGCGKSTTLRLITGLEKPDQGSIWIDDRDVSKTPARRRDVSMVFQNDRLYPHFSVLENLRFATQQSVKRETLQQRIDHAAEMLGIEALLKRRVDRLSGGEMRRVAVAKSIVRQASVRLLDEPLSAIDVSSRHALQHDLRHWHDAMPALTIHVTHDGQEAMRMADRIAVIHDGRIVQVDTPETIYQHPKSMAAALAIGVPPMNFIPGKIENRSLRLNVGLEAVHSIEGLLKDSADKLIDVMIGIRPEAISVAAANQTTEPTARGITLPGRCQWVKTYQGMRHAQIRVGSVYLETLSECQTSFDSGDEVMLQIGFNSIHLYDVASTMELTIRRCVF